MRRAAGAALVCLACLTVGLRGLAAAGEEAVAWRARYLSGGGGDYVYAMALAPQAGVVAAAGWGVAPGASHPVPQVVAFDLATGAVRWVAREGSEGTFWAVASSPDGSRIYATGAESRDYLTVAYEAASGRRLWSARYDGPARGYDAAFGLAVAPGGQRVFVTGSSQGADLDWATVAYDAADGAQLWVARHDGPGHSSDSARAVAADSSRVVVGGYEIGSSVDWALEAYDAAGGARLWSASYDGPGHDYDELYALSVSPQAQAVYATGYSVGVGSSQDVLTASYDLASGSLSWAARDESPGYDAGHAIAASQDGSMVAVAGVTAPDGPPDYLVVAYDASGRQLWRQTYDGPAADSDGAYAVAFAGDLVVVTGESSGPTGSDVATAAYDASSGRMRWVTRYDSGGPEGGSAVAPLGPTLLVGGHGASCTSSEYGALVLAQPLEPPPAPMAAFSMEPEVPIAGEPVSFSDRSSDPSGLVERCWQLGDGTTSIESGPTHVYEDFGTYTAVLTVTNAFGLSSSAEVTFDVLARPQAAFTFSPQDPRVGVSVAFEDLSADPDGQVVAFAWDFGDGEGSTERNPIHTYRRSGLFVVTLTVTHDSGLSAQAVAQLEVRGPPSAPQGVRAEGGPGPLGEVTVAWEEPEDPGYPPLDAYLLWRVGPEGRQLVAELPPGERSFTERGLVAPGPYRYQVTARGPEGDSPPSAVACAASSPAGLVAAASALLCRAGGW